MNQTELHTLGIDIGSTTVKIAVLDSNNDVLFSDYERHFANIQETLSDLLGRAIYKLGQIKVSPMITGSGGLTPVSYTHLKERLPPSALFLPPQRFSEFLLFPQRSQMHLQSNSHSAHQNDSADS